MQLGGDPLHSVKRVRLRLKRGTQLDRAIGDASDQQREQDAIDACERLHDRVDHAGRLAHVHEAAQ